MKLNKSKSLVAISAFGVLAVLSIAGVNYVNAQSKPQAEVAMPSDTTPVVPGSFSGGSIATTKYTPTCTPFVFDMDADAINRARDRAFVVAENARFNQLRDRWDNYENCITINARRDIDTMRDIIGDNVVNEAEKESTLMSALNAAASENLNRVKELAKAPPKKAKKGTAEAAVAALPASTWVKPVGRKIGSVVSGPVNKATYISGCPVFSTPLTPAAFAAVTTGDGFNALIEVFKTVPGQITEARDCRNENGQKDYTDIQNVIQDGLNAVYVPAKTEFDAKYTSVRNQLNLQREPGGLLASPAPRAAPPKAKKKK